eukprot:jgi/Tetstr1/463668/TSEL_008529.t1
MKRRQALRNHFCGCRMLPYMDDFSLFASSWVQAYAVCDRLTSLLGRLARVPTCLAQFMFLAFKPAQFDLRELHDVLRTRDSWSGRVRMTHQLRRNLKWSLAVPNHSNGHSIYKPVETGYMHVDSSGYMWGTVLNETTEARGF